MFRPSAHHRQFLAMLCALLWSTAGGQAGSAVDFPSRLSEATNVAMPNRCVKNLAQFKNLPPETYLEGCSFHLTGVVTLVDTNRDLMVLQDETGAVALNFPLRGTGLRFGQRVYLEGTNCCPYFARFPDFPLRPSGRERRDSFEAPTGFGEYYLSRMRGYLHPPVTGEYSFWIASDNSSELWLSSDGSPSKTRKIAFIPRFSWVAPREWSHFPSQHSESVRLQAGQTYYIEALQEQTTVGDNLAVAWQGPGLDQSVIDGSYLTPCAQGLTELATNGVLREYWTNFVAGDLADLGGVRPYRSALTVKEAGVRVLDPGNLPKPELIVPGQPWPAENDYRWVTTQGLVKFTGADKATVWFELAGELAQVQVRMPRLENAFLQRMQNARVEVEGVCEGVYGKNETLESGIIWVSDAGNFHFIETAKTNVQTTAVEQADSAATTNNHPAMQGFYSTRGVVTFNDRVLDRDFLIVQEDKSAMLVSGGETSIFQKQLKVGEWVELGGAVQPGKYLPVLAPLVITDLGWHSMPVPITQALEAPVPADRAGKWCEVEGIVHSVTTNGMLAVVSKDGVVYFWTGHAPASELTAYVDAKLRAHGVLMPNALDAPLLLVPSPNFVDEEETAPDDPFTLSRRPIADLTAFGAHRAKVSGEITYRDNQSFFLQDESGGIRVQSAAAPTLAIGETVDVVAFSMMSGGVRTLADAHVRAAAESMHVLPRNMDGGEAISAKQWGTLVLISATLLGRKTNELGDVLELEEQQRIFSATLATNSGRLPEIQTGSRLRVVGVCENGTAATPAAGETSSAMPLLASLNILLRNPADVTILSGPPWWTWKRTVTLVGALMIILAVTLLWVHLLQRRLERQRAAQLASSRQVLAQVEDERRRIAVNLHDSLGQILLVIKNHALLAIQRPPDEQGLRQRLDEISRASSQAIDEVRQITHDLRPYQLDRLGLTRAIRASVSQVSADSSILFAIRVEEIDGLFDKEAEIHVYRIVQETVTNVVKHSAATEAAVVIKKRSAAVIVSIRDNGRGFDPAKTSPQPRDVGYGLIGIADRARILGGTLTIDSRLGEGTSLTVEVPLPICKT